MFLKLECGDSELVFLPCFIRLRAASSWISVVTAWDLIPDRIGGTRARRLGRASSPVACPLARMGPVRGTCGFFFVPLYVTPLLLLPPAQCDVIAQLGGGLSGFSVRPLLPDQLTSDRAR